MHKIANALVLLVVLSTSPLADEGNSSDKVRFYDFRELETATIKKAASKDLYMV